MGILERRIGRRVKSPVRSLLYEKNGEGRGSKTGGTSEGREEFLHPSPTPGKAFFLGKESLPHPPSRKKGDKTFQRAKSLCRPRGKDTASCR